MSEHPHSTYGLENHELTNVGDVYWNLHTPELYEHVVRNGEGQVAHLGPIVTRTGLHTGRAAKDKFIVEESENKDLVWWGPVNKSIGVDKWDQMFRRLQAYLQGRNLYVQDVFAGADPNYRLPVRIINQLAYHNLFARTMFIRATHEEQKVHEPQFTVLHAPYFQAIPEVDGTYSSAFILLNLRRKMVLIGGTHYSGEMKKSIFSVMNFLLPQENVMSMHCSANVGEAGDVAVFFGLSGTGKTTLSADPKRKLVGDDEHGWSEDGVFNFEGGCYAKVIRLSEESEPDIYATTRRFGTILENVAYDSVTRQLDLDDASLTQNTRAAYPLTHIDNIVPSGMAGHPKNVIMLTCDAFGVMPPLSRMTPAQAMYHFVSGYTAKVAGTESGITEPQATFSACFGAPFMVLHPSRYAELLAEKVRKHDVSCWLVNTGWTGGPFGVGERMSIKHTRALLNAALEGQLDDVEFEEDPIFGLQVPKTCPGVPSEVLNPRNTWSDKTAYDDKAKMLAGLFVENFAEYASKCSDEVKAAGPKVG